MGKSNSARIVIVLLAIVLVFQFVIYNKTKLLESENQNIRSRIDHLYVMNTTNSLSSRIDELSELIKGQYETIKEVKFESKYENSNIILTSNLELYKGTGSDIIWLHYKDPSGETGKVVMENIGGTNYSAEFKAKANTEYHYWFDINGELTGIETIPPELNSYQTFRFKFINTEIKHNELKSARIIMGMETKPYLPELAVDKIYLCVYDGEGNELDSIDVIKSNLDRVRVPEDERENFSRDKLMVMMAAGDLYIELDAGNYSKPIKSISAECLYNNGETVKQLLFEDGALQEFKRK